MYFYHYNEMFKWGPDTGRDVKPCESRNSIFEEILSDKFWMSNERGF